MKIVKLTFIALTATLVMSCGQKKENTNQEENVTTSIENQTAENTEAVVNPEEAPVLTLEQEIYDLGDVQAGSVTEKIIEFTNTGKSPLLIQNASASCGCTVPEYSKEPVAPGEKGTLKVSYSAPAVNGLQTKTVTLNTNTANSIENFRIKANVVGGNENPNTSSAPQNLPAPNLGNIN